MTRHQRDNDPYADALDARGILKDGKRIRVSMQMRDAAMLPEITDDTDDPLGLHKPGNRYIADSPVFDEARERLYREVNDIAANAWKNPPMDDPPPATADAKPKQRFSDAREQAYADAQFDAENAWRKPVTF